MQSGDIIFFRPESIIFRVIRFITKGTYGHVAICAGKLGSHTLLIEANPWGVDINSLTFKINAKQKYTVYRINKITVYERELLIEKMLEFVGNQYDFKALIRFVFKKPSSKNNKKNFCSEFIFRGLVDLDYLEVNLANPNMVSPHKLRTLLEKYKVARIVEKSYTGELK